MFDFTATSGILGDCTTWYSVSSDGKTVNDLIDFVIRCKRQEWGEIRIVPNGGNWILDNICELEYSYGKITKDNIPEDIKNKCISKIDANGGWSNMDYIVYLDIEKKGNRQ